MGENTPLQAKDFLSILLIVKDSSLIFRARLTGLLTVLVPDIFFGDTAFFHFVSY